MLRRQTLTAVATSAAVRPVRSARPNRSASARRHRRGRGGGDRVHPPGAGRATASRHRTRRRRSPVTRPGPRDPPVRSRRARRSPPATRSATITSASWYEYGIRSRNPGGSSGNSSTHRAGDGGAELVRLDAVPHRQLEPTLRTQHAGRLGERFDLGREEHRAELAHDDVERRVVVGQILRVGDVPRDRTRRAVPLGALDHARHEVGGGDRHRRRQRVGQDARVHPGTARDHEHVAVAHATEASREVVGVGLEAERHEQLVVHVEDRRGLDASNEGMTGAWSSVHATHLVATAGPATQSARAA